MAARRRPQPLIQGELDGLCGIYSVINSLAWALHSLSEARQVLPWQSRPLRQEDCDRLFLALVSAMLYRRRKFRSIVDGTTVNDILRLLRTATSWLITARQLELKVDRPFYNDVRVATRTILTEISTHLR